jgi:SagB-type dehydrogenase family enzyme
MVKDTGRTFMQYTRYQHLDRSQQEEGLVPQPPLQKAGLPDAPRFNLPAVRDLAVPGIDLRQAIEQRRSLRAYRKQPLSLAELAFLLWCTQGVKKVSQRPVTLRTVPSAGARHAFETYLLVNRVDELPAGLYHYLAIEHQLEQLPCEGDIAAEVTGACLGQEQVPNSAVTFIWAADLPRMVWRYGERGYRYLHLDAGHVCQNLYLAAEAVGCGVCAIAAFDDDALNIALNLDGEDEFVVYLATLGKKA